MEPATLCHPECDDHSVAQGVARRVRRLERALVEDKQCICIWSDGVYLSVQPEEDRTGILSDGRKEVTALDGYRESKESWASVLRELDRRNTPAQAPRGDRQEALALDAACDWPCQHSAAGLAMAGIVSMSSALGVVTDLLDFGVKRQNGCTHPSGAA